MMHKLLAIGSVVSLHNSSQKIMVMGYLQKSKNEEKVWDYAGILYPNGFISTSKILLFDSEQIDTIYWMGCQDQEQMSFQNRLLENLKKGSEVYE